MEQSTRILCTKCKYSSVLVTLGEEYNFINANGDEVTRVHSDTILECRFMPPIGGMFPQVSEDDWCGQAKLSA